MNYSIIYRSRCRNSQLRPRRGAYVGPPASAAYPLTRGAPLVIRHNGNRYTDGQLLSAVRRVLVDGLSMDAAGKEIGSNRCTVWRVIHGHTRSYLMPEILRMRDFKEAFV